MTEPTTPTTAVAPAPASPLLAPLLTLSIPEEDAIKSKGERALTLARAVVIQTQDDYESAAETLGQIVTLKDKLELGRTELVGPLNNVVRAINRRYKPGTEFVEQAEGIVKDAMLRFCEAQERIAAEERRLREAEAARERQRLHDEGEARRREAAEQTAALQRQAEDATAAGDAGAAAEAQRTIEHVQQTAALECAAIETLQTVTVAAPPCAAPPKAAGVSLASGYDFKVTDLFALVGHVAQNRQLLNLLCVDSVRLRAYVKSLGENTKLPGVTVNKKKTVRAGRS